MKSTDAVIVDLLPGRFEMVLNSTSRAQNPSGEPAGYSPSIAASRMIVFSDLAVGPPCLRIRSAP